MKLGVKVVRLNKELPLPKHATEGSAGVDLYANIKKPIVMYAGDTVVIPTGIKVEIPPSYEMQVRPRSGLAVKNNITVLNTPGTIDSDFRGEVGVVLYYAPTRKGLIETIKNYLVERTLLHRIFKSEEPTVIINPADRIAQAVFTKYEQVHFYPVKELTDTERGEGKFGSTGVVNNG
jgi:dUTP pyrophosphatase